MKPGSIPGAADFNGAYEQRTAAGNAGTSRVSSRDDRVRLPAGWDVDIALQGR